MPESCGFRFDHDPETLDPRGPACGAPTVQAIHWLDGRVSNSCVEHGMKALDDDAKELVRLVVPTRALTCWQPWAFLVAGGFKPVENRPPGISFKSFRGEFWIHAGAEPNDKAFQHEWRRAHDLAKQLLGESFRFPCYGELSFGAIIGKATITGIIPPRLKRADKPPELIRDATTPAPVPWHFPEQYGFKLENARRLEKPVLCRGYQGFWNVPADVLSELERVA